MIGLNTQQKVLLKFRKKYKKRFNIKYLKPLYQFAVFFGLAPYYNFSKQTKVTKLYLMPQILMGTAIFLSYVHFLDGSIKVFFKGSILTEIVVDSVLYIFISILNLVCVVFSSLWNRKKWRKLLKTFQKIDRIIGQDFARQTNWWFLLETFIQSALVLAILGYECSMFVRVFSFKRYNFYLFQRIQYYFIFISVQLICNLSLCLKHRMEFFNDLLQMCLKEKINAKALKNLHATLPVKGFATAINLYLHLNQLVRLYNEVFGWEILLLMGTVMLALLETLNFVLGTGINQKQILELYQYEMLIVSIVMSLMILLWGIMVIFCCDNANREAHKTATICYQLLTELPENSPETEKLLYLAQHAAHRCPQITAANVFVVNINALFGIMGSLTSYVIVLISFNNNNASPTSTVVTNATVAPTHQ